ncbi:MAG TPA: PKD domain-containing protein, partial [Bacteroidales bacterium]|nr:PKD domain-containing protein [Bacteroidales bacterium]
FGDPASGNNNSSKLKDPAHRFDTSGRYNVKLLVMNESGCKDSLIKPTRVHALPEAAFRTGLACSDNPTYFTDRTTPGDTTLQLWRWNFGEPGTKKDTAMIQNPAYQYNTEGNYVVRMIVRDKNGCYDTVDSTVTVFVSPISAFSLTELMNGMPGKILLNNQSVGAETYDWDFGNGIGSTDENPVITYSEDGTYLIRLISYSKKDCSDTTYYRYDVLFKGLYIPNAFAPTSGAMGASIFKPVGINLKSFNIEVFDAWGHRVWNSKALDNLGRPAEVWDGKDKNGNLMPQATYMWKASATFIDGTIWEGSDIGKGEYKTYGTVTLIR